MKLCLTLLLFTLGLNAQWSYLGEPGVSEWDSKWISTSVNPVSREPYVAFMDKHYRLSVKRWTGNEWVYVGKYDMSEGPIKHSSIDFNSKGVPYVAYTDGFAENSPTVRKFNGTEWEVLGKRGITGTSGNFISLDVDASDNVFVAFREGCAENPGGIRTSASVMKFNGTKWEFVGNRWLADTGQKYPGLMDLSLRVDSKGMPYVAYQDDSMDAPGGTTVKRFNGTSWEFVGKSSFAKWCAMYSRAIAIDSKDRPYLVCRNKQGTTTAMRFENGEWSEFGTPCPIVWGSEWGSIEIVNDVPYIAMQDYSAQRHLSVIRCIGGKWDFVEKQSVSPGSVMDVALAVDADENLYVAFADSKGPVTRWQLSVMKYSNPTVSVKENKNNNNINVFPNPSGSVFSIDGLSQEVEVIVQDITGKTVYRTPHFSGRELDLSHLPRGVYVLAIRTNEGVETKKLVLE
jgi:hypothetical protein